ncbi:hypothetical protein AB0A05_27210 [Streptomyces sp. NPDC046374]|uniref:hypothetical protein n=1 Tax=Streptomyces sp. NPDC046374 TaxID=3154917 RepID=UPI0033D024BC
MEEITATAQFPGRVHTRPPLPEQPVCTFDTWPMDPDGYLQDIAPIGAAYDGPDSSGKPTEYAKYLVYGFDVAGRRLWCESDELYVPSAGGIDGYVATRPPRRMHGVYPYRFWVSLDRLTKATIHHRVADVSALMPGRCAHVLVRNGVPVDRHAGHHECFELFVCNERMENLAQVGRAHGEQCTSWRMTTGFCEEKGKQLALKAGGGFEHAYIKRVHDGAVIAGNRLVRL